MVNMAPIINPSCEISPLKTWDELEGWKEPQTAVHEAVVGVTKLKPRNPSPSASNPKTLLCHDMMGGYLDDRFYEGTSNASAYRFYHWSGVDTFVYFSHKSVTIPPPAWINAAHCHGVKVLGTFITEWEEGEAFCGNLLASEESISKGVSQLVAIAKYHGFEGWLLNIENPIQPTQVESLLSFVRQLRQGMKEVCEEAEVVWYDSVTVDGELKWQNELNDKNRAFYEASDGIFLNYTWTEDHLRRSRKEAGGGEGVARVYVGLDVFGRNFYEGGKFNTYKALEVVRSHGLSAAIFAPGWTYETQKNFVDAERKMWSSFNSFLTHRGPGQLPVRTSFCQGHGHAQYADGKVVKPEPWHNLSRQQLQPLWVQEGEGAELSLVTSEAYNGGGCLGVTVTVPREVKLFVCGLKWRVSLVVSVWYKWKGPVVPFTLFLRLHSATNTSLPNRTVELRCCKVDVETSSDKEGNSPRENTGGDNENESDQASKDTDKSSENVGVEEKRKEDGDDDTIETKRTRFSKCDVSLVDSSEENGWTLRTFAVGEDEGWEVCEVGVVLGAPSTLLLGHLTLYNRCIKGMS